LSTADQSHSQFAIQRLIDTHFFHSSLCLLIKFLCAYQLKKTVAKVKLLSNTALPGGNRQTADAHDNSACSAKQAASEFSRNAGNNCDIRPAIQL
jgi:hypothetical protein